MPDVAPPPPDLSTFVGRAREVDEIADLVAPGRLVTLLGPGGCGKTRLAARVARGVRGDTWSDGARWVALEGEGDADAVAARAARQLDVLLPAGADPLTGLVEVLRDRKAVLVLDNCEHIAAAAARLARAVLADNPGIDVLATSRVPLGVAGEVAWRVPPLALEDAVALLSERAGTAARVVSPETARRICDSLDRLPLGLELAAGWMGTLSASQIAEALREPLALLGDAAGRGTLRQQSLEASIRWSHDLLGPAEQVAFRRLSVLEPGFTAQLAVGLLGAPDVAAASALGSVRRLVDASLLVADTTGPIATYRMLVMVRAYALARLEAAAETDAVRDAMLDAALAAIADLEPLLDTDRDTWRDCVRRLYPTVMAAVEWGLARTDPTRGRRLVAGLAWLWHLEYDGPHGLAVIERALKVGDGERTALQARLLVAAALVADTAVGGGAGYHYAEEAVALADQLLSEPGGDVDALAGVSRLGRSLIAVGLVGSDLDAAEQLAASLRTEATAVGDAFVADASGALLGYLTMQHDRYPDTITALEAPLPSLLARGDRGIASHCLGWLAMAHARCLRLDDAARLAEQAVATAGPLRDFHRIGSARCILADVFLTQGRVAEARTALEPIDRVLKPLADPPFIPLYELLHALLEVEAGRFEEAAAWCRREGRWLPEPSDDRLTLRTRITLAWALLRSGDRVAAARVVESMSDVPDEPSRAVHWAAVLVLRAALHHGSDPDQALALHHEALQEYMRTAHDMGLIMCLDALAWFHTEHDELERAAILSGATDRARADTGFHGNAAIPAYRSLLAERLPEAELVAARARGEAMDLREVVAWASRSRGPRRRPTSGWASLTPTEVQIAALAAEGLTNPQIAERLFISRSTVKTHLEHIYAKLDIAGRTELARVHADRA